MNGNLKQEQYFHVKLTGGNPVVRGHQNCFLGHKVPGESGRESEGVFVEWKWDGAALQVKTDQFAFYPVYYWCGSQEFAISTSIMKLFELGAPKELDYTGLAIFLRLSSLIGEYTVFKHIKALPPGAELKWSRGQLSVKSHMAVEKVNKIPRDDAIDQFIHLFRRSIARRLPKDDDSVVPLSGGRDSRHILLELVQQGRKPKFCITYEQFAGKSFGEDVRVAAALCRELEIKHVCLNQTEKYSAVEIRKNYHTNFCSDKHQQMYVLAEYLADSTEVLYDGLAGDTLSKSNYPSLAYVELYRKQKYEELAIDCFRRYSCDENDFRRFFHKQFYAKINFDQAIAALASELKKYAAAADPFTAFRFWNRTRRDIALLPYRVLERVPTVFTPYLDHELFRFLSSLPGDMAGDREFHTDSIRRAYPRHAHIPFENEGPKKSPAILDKKTAEINRGVAFYYLSRFKFRGSIFDTNYLLPRMMRCLCSTKYAASLNWLPMPRVLFLTQLADFVEKPYRLA